MKRIELIIGSSKCLGRILGLAGLCLGTVSAQAQPFSASAQRDIEQGAEAAKLVEQQIGIYAAPVTEAYVREVGERLAAASRDRRWSFRFQIADQPEPNAFAVPGGGIYVSRGLLALINREDELAGVLGHEIAHVTQRHSASRQRRGFLPGLLALPGNVVGAVVSDNLGSLINAPVNTIGGALLSTYSRGQESEADRIGIRAAAESGYAPTALADILLRLEQDVAAQTDQERRFSIFDSHPMAETRLKDIRKRSTALAVSAKAPVAKDRKALLGKLDGMWCGENPETGVFRKGQFLHPLNGFTITFPEGWKNQNTPGSLISSHPKKDAALMLSISEKESDPEAAGQKFINRMRAKAKLDPASTRKTSIGEFPAFVVTYLDRSGRTPVFLHFAWVTMAGKMYELMGLGPDKYREILKTAALSLRPLTAAERGSITGKRLRVVEARQDERLEDLSARTGNAWSPAYTALVNGLNKEAALSAGQLLKIARVEPVISQ